VSDAAAPQKWEWWAPKSLRGAGWPARVPGCAPLAADAPSLPSPSPLPRFPCPNSHRFIAAARAELERMLSEDELREAVVLVFANKQDLPKAMPVAEVTEKLGLHRLSARKVRHSYLPWDASWGVLCSGWDIGPEAARGIASHTIPNPGPRHRFASHPNPSSSVRSGTFRRAARPTATACTRASTGSLPLFATASEGEMRGGGGWLGGWEHMCHAREDMQHHVTIRISGAPPHSDGLEPLPFP
jgi:hypothetical protein